MNNTKSFIDEQDLFEKHSIIKDINKELEEIEKDKLIESVEETKEGKSFKSVKEFEKLKEVKKSSPSLKFAIQIFKLNCCEISKSATNDHLKYDYSTLADINNAIRKSSAKTLEHFNGNIIVFVQTDDIYSIESEEKNGRVGVGIELSINAVCRNTGNIEKEVLRLQYRNCIPITEISKGLEGAKAYSALITYLEKKAKSCMLHLSDGVKDDLDSLFTNNTPIKETPEIEGLDA